MEIIFVTTNTGKLAEAQRLGKDHGIEFIANDYDAIEMRSSSPEEIALDSARDAYEKIGKPLIVEDSGMFIDHFKGFPGTYSAYIFKTIRVDGVLKLMEGVENRRASMMSAVAYTDGKDYKSFLGEVHGTVPDAQRGMSGFGYDPIFIPDGYEKTFGEDLVYKAEVSHRARSLKQFCEWFSNK